MKKHRTPLLLTATLQFTSRLGMNLLLQFRLRELGASLFEVSLLSAFRGGISTLMSPLWGAISDRKGGRKSTILVSVLGTAGFVPLYLFLSNPWGILAVTAIVAFFSSGFNPVAMALSTEYSSGKNSSQARELSFLNSSNSLGMLISRFLVGVLLLYFTVRSALVIFVILTIVAVVPALFIEDVPKRSDRNSISSGTRSSKHIAHLMKKNGLWAIYVSSSLRQFGISGSLALAAIYLTERVGFSKSSVGFVSAINPMIQIPSHLLFAKLIEGTRAKTVAALGMTLSAGVSFLFLIAHSPLEIGLAYALLGIAFGAFINGTSVFISKATNPDERARALGLLNSSRQIGFMTGPIVAGVLASISYSALFSTMTLAMLSGAVLTAVFSRESDENGTR